MKASLIPLSLITALAAAAGVTAAEHGATQMTAPGHLMPMDQVRSRFGAPDRMLEAVGDPPITRWVYAGYTVYFERELVLTSVRHRAP